MNHAYPERITQARESRGISKTDLAEQIGVTPAAVAQWESGAKSPTAENLIALARILRVDPSLLMRPYPQSLNRKGIVSFRAWGAANTRRANKTAERAAEMVAEIYHWIGDQVSLPPVVLPEIHFDGDFDAAATACRRHWGLGDRPILKLGELLESKGIIITDAFFGDARVDAFSCVIDGMPMIFLGAEKGDRARTRFDAAHELGHLLLHQHLTEGDLKKSRSHKEIERQANYFAGAFLMPAETFAQDVGTPTLDGFLKLKPKWGVSVQAMVVRSRQLKLITEDYYLELYRQISLKGWRRSKGEPFDDTIPETRGSLGKKSLQVLEEHSLIQAHEIPVELPMPTSILSNVFGRDPYSIEPEVFSKILPFKSFV